MYEESNENLPYISSTQSLNLDEGTPNLDEGDQGSLHRLKEMIDERIAVFQTTDALTINDPVFTIEQQLANRKQHVQDLREFKLLVETALEQLKEV